MSTKRRDKIQVRFWVSFSLQTHRVISHGTWLKLNNRRAGFILRVSNYLALTSWVPHLSSLDSVSSVPQAFSCKIRGQVKV